jgi:hypothetical protein
MYALDLQVFAARKLRGIRQESSLVERAEQVKDSIFSTVHCDVR